MNNKNLNFNGENIYVGIDVHKKSWTVTIETDELQLKTFTQDPEPEKLIRYLKRNYPGAKYRAAYEAGYFGYWICERLNDLGVECIIVNPADIPTSDKEKKQKRDAIDSRKIARGLKNGDYNPVYVPDREAQGFRTLIRAYRKLVQDIAKGKTRIKAMLEQWGIKVPDEFTNTRTLSMGYLSWLQGLDESALPVEAKTALEGQIKQCQEQTKVLKELDQKIRGIVTEKHQAEIALLKSIPGIGDIAAREIFSEIIDINRFKTLDHLKSYVGLIPTTQSSGEHERTGNLTKRGNKYLKSLLVQCSWRALKNDPQLLLTYKNHLKSGKKKNKALIRIASNMLSRIRYVLKHKKPFEVKE